ncbi:MAG TPA: helix-turn-helix domain-containing protein [Blastocatellia bacterium]|jgi:transcriptional regulator with XRE-family HTH domain
MSKPNFQFKKEAAVTSSGGEGDDSRRSPLADLVSQRLRLKGLRQVDFCRQAGFDQGLLSKILSSVVNTLNVESALKLADGLDIPPSLIFEVIGKREVDEMLRRFYCNSHRLM